MISITEHISNVNFEDGQKVNITAELAGRVVYLYFLFFELILKG